MHFCQCIVGKKRLKQTKMLEVVFFGTKCIFSRTDWLIPYSTVPFKCSENGCGLMLFTHECAVSSSNISFQHM